MTFWLAEPASHSGSTNVWLTPRWILDALGPFDLDPASCPSWPTANKHYTESENGLYQPWFGLVWCNPPYGINTQEWVSRFVEHKNGFLLVAARTDTQWFHDAVNGSDLLWLPRKRIRFVELSTGSESKSPAFASCIFSCGEEATRRLRTMTGAFVKGLNP